MKKVTVLNCAVALILLLTLLIPATAKGKIYYVDRNHPSASDSNPGTIDKPWKTIGHAAETLQAGDTVFIRDGVYNEHIYIENSGNGPGQIGKSGNAPGVVRSSDDSGYIVFAAYENENPIIDGTGVTESQNGIVLDKSYIKLIGLEIRNWEENAIWVEGASHLEISDCVVHDVAYGIGLGYGTHDFILNRVVMHDFDLYGFDASPNGEDCYNGALNDCIAHTGRDPDQNVDGFAIGHGTQHDVTLNRCEAYDVYDGFDVGENAGDDSINIVLSRCTAYGCWNDGYKFTGGGTMVNCLSYNNSSSNVDVCWGTHGGTVTLQNCSFADAETFNIWVENSLDSLHMYNCILAGGDNIGLAFEQMDIGNYEGDYNIFHNDNSERGIVVAYEDEFSLAQIESGAWTNYSGQDSNSLVSRSAGKIYLDPLNYDLHLVKDSIAIDSGTSTAAPREDFDGNARPSGGGWDIGAYEFKVGEIEG